MGFGVGRGLMLSGLLASLAACSQTTRVGESTTADNLSKSAKAVAVMRLGAASINCRHAGVWLGVREGAGFRPHTPVSVIHLTSLEDVPVAEVELHPGEYHVLSYACGADRGVKQISTMDRTTGLVRESYASFRLAAGEIVNVGSFEFHVSRVGLNAFGRPFRTTVTVNDWPLADIERYKAKRPHIYAQMQTRLMTPTPRGPRDPGEDDCETLRQLKAEGKVQNLPAACAAPAEAPAKVKSTAKDR